MIFYVNVDVESYGCKIPLKPLGDLHERQL